MAGSSRISVILPVFNGEALLPATLRSLEAQDRSRMEAVFVDDCSSDGTGDLVETWLSKSGVRGKLIRHPRNLGPGEAFKTAVREASGDYLLAFAQDDRLPAGYVSRAIEVMGSPSVAVGVPGHFVLDERTAKRVAVVKGESWRELFGWDLTAALLGGYRVMTPGCVIRKDLFDESFMGDFNLMAQDHEMLLNLSLLGEFSYIDSLVAYPRHDGNLSTRAGSVDEHLDLGLAIARFLNSRRLGECLRALDPRDRESVLDLFAFHLNTLRDTRPLTWMVATCRGRVPEQLKELKATSYEDPERRIEVLLDDYSRLGPSHREHVLHELLALDPSSSVDASGPHGWGEAPSASVARRHARSVYHWLTELLPFPLYSWVEGVRRRWWAPKDPRALVPPPWTLGV